MSLESFLYIFLSFFFEIITVCDKSNPSHFSYLFLKNKVVGIETQEPTPEGSNNNIMFILTQSQHTQYREQTGDLR